MAVEGLGSGATNAMATGERLVLARLAAQRAGRAATARVLRSTGLKNWLAPSIADEFHIVPQDLRTPDPSFLVEIAAHQFGLAGAVANLAGLSPFAVPPPTAGWARELHGFGWLRHLRVAANDEDAQDAAQAFVLSWLELGKSPTVSFEAQVIARRIISWISHADLLLEGSTQRTYTLIADSLGTQIQLLAATRNTAPPGPPRLLCLSALLFASLCVAGHDRRHARLEKAFLAELDHQVLPDGGHASRNPAFAVDLLLDLLPLRQCYVARQIALPDGLTEAIDRMIACLKFMRRGDGALARFNGTGRTEVDALATVIGYGELRDPETAKDNGEADSDPAPKSGYQRLQREKTVILMDVGSPPALAFSGQAHAGCLSFELSYGPHPVFVNIGAPAPMQEASQAMARATVSHNTLCLNNTSSSRLVPLDGAQLLVGLQWPDGVESNLVERDGSLVLEAWHDGYLNEFGLLHARCLVLSAGGERLDGIDRLEPPSGVLRMRRDLPFSIHFHLPSEAICRLGETPETAEIQVEPHSYWRLTAAGARLAIEASTDLVHLSGPRRAMQIVLRGACPGETTVTWSLEHICSDTT
jgi:uncharacterized heparinase superfamily protein